MPEEVVKANHRCVNVVAEPELKCVRADFISNQEVETNPYAHWDDKQEKNKSSTLSSSQLPQSEITSIRAKLLIAADGINSTVRQVIYKDTPYSEYSKPEYSGVVAISSGGVYEIPEALRQKIQEQFIKGSRVVTILNQQIVENSTENETTRMILFSRQSGQFGYVIHAPFFAFRVIGRKVRKRVN